MAEPEEAVEQEGSEETPKKKGKLLVIVGLLVGLGGGGAAGAKFLAPMIGEKLADSAEAGEGEAGNDAGDEASDDDGEGGGGGGRGEGGGVLGTVELHSIENIFLNPAGESRRLLLATVAFETSDDSYDDAILARDLQLRDKLNLIFGQKTTQQLTDFSVREVLVEEIRLGLEEVLGEGSVVQVYLPQFVIQ